MGKCGDIDLGPVVVHAKLVHSYVAFKIHDSNSKLFSYNVHRTDRQQDTQTQRNHAGLLYSCDGDSATIKMCRI